VELKHYLDLIRRWLWLLLLGVGLGAASAFIVSRLQPPVYQATTTLLVSEAPQGSAASDYQALLTSERLARTYAQLLTSRPVLEDVIVRLHLPTTAELLAEAVRVELVRDTQLIKVRAEHTDPAQAASLANTLADVFREFIQAQQVSRFAESKTSLLEEISSVEQQIADIQRQVDDVGEPEDAAAQARLDRLQSDLVQLRASRTELLQSYENLRLAEAQFASNVTIVETAAPPPQPIRPRTAVNTALTGVIGLLLTVGIAFLIEYLDDTLKTPDQVLGLLSLPVIGVLARLSPKQSAAGAIAQTEPRSPAAEAFRGLRTNLQFASIDRPLRRILVTSTGPGEGKSTVAANLAVVLAQANQRVAIIDADLRRPTQHKLFDLPNRFGLSDTLIQDSLHLNGALQPVAVPNLVLLSSGVVPPNPAELLGSQRMGSLVELAGQLVERIIIDAPPVGAVTDAVILTHHADGVVLVIEAGKTRIGAALQVKEQLDRVGAKVVGVVLNKVPIGRNGRYYNYHYGYYASGYEEADPAQPRRGAGRGWWRRPTPRATAAREAAEASPNPKGAGAP
jgi:non-specific protein-tyrosine kinase